MSRDAEVKNAKIRGTMLGIEDHGIMTAFIELDYGGAGQGFGGYGFDNPHKTKEEPYGRRGTAFGCEFIRRVLDVVGVEKWEDLKGKHVRVVATWDKVKRIGHIIEEKWFDPEELAREMKGELQKS